MNGIGSAQQFPVATEAAASSSASRASKAGMDGVPSSAQDVAGNGVQVDDAKLSSSAALVMQALSGSDVRMDKVLPLQQAIAAGTYSVPSADVASKVMSVLIE